MKELLNKRTTYVGASAHKGYHIVVVATTTNGDPYVHTLLLGKEKVTGGEMVNIFTNKFTKDVFELSQLKSLVFDLLYKVANVDYRDLNFTVSDLATSTLDADFFHIVGDFSEKYRKQGLKHLSLDYVKDTISNQFVFDYEPVNIVISNDLPKAKYSPIDPSLYTSLDDINNIEHNRLTVEGTRLPKCATTTLEAFKRGSHTCALFYGEASTGKSFAARIIASELGIPVYSYNFAAGSDESFVQGKYAPKEDEAGFTFLQNMFIKAYSEGGLFVAEELNYAYANVTGPLNSALDFLKKITLANEKQIDVHPNFRMITCINPGYEGTQPINRALLSRQEIVVRFENLTPAEIAARLESRYGFANIEFATKLGSFIDKLNRTLYSQSIDGYVSLREVESCLKLAQISGVTLTEAIKESILNKVMLNETTSIYNTIFDTIKSDIKELDELYTQEQSTDPDLIDLVVANVNDSDVEDIFAAAKAAYSTTTAS